MVLRGAATPPSPAPAAGGVAGWRSRPGRGQTCPRMLRPRLAAVALLLTACGGAAALPTPTPRCRSAVHFPSPSASAAPVSATADQAQVDPGATVTFTETVDRAGHRPGRLLPAAPGPGDRQHGAQRLQRLLRGGRGGRLRHAHPRRAAPARATRSSGRSTPASQGGRTPRPWFSATRPSSPSAWRSGRCPARADRATGVDGSATTTTLSQSGPPGWRVQPSNVSTMRRPALAKQRLELVEVEEAAGGLLDREAAVREDGHLPEDEDVAGPVVDAVAEQQLAPPPEQRRRPPPPRPRAGPGAGPAGAGTRRSAGPRGAGRQPRRRSAAACRRAVRFSRT